MPAPRKISERQTELLVDFAEANPRIALGCFPRGPNGTRMCRQIWKSVAVKLNSVAEGTKKSPQEWRRYWIDFKAKTKAKGADSRRQAAVTGGGPNKLLPLNTLEKRVLAFTGEIAVDRKPEIQLPIESSAPNPETDLNMHEEWLEVEMSPLPGPHAIYLPDSIETDSLLVQRTGNGPHKEKSYSQHSNAPRMPIRRSRPQTQSGAEEQVPRWVFDIESRRLAAEERNAAAMEAMVNIMREMKNDLHSYLNRLKTENS